MLLVLAAWAAFLIVGPAGYAYTGALRGTGLPGSASLLSALAFVSWCLLRTYRAAAYASTVVLTSSASDLQIAALLAFALALGMAVRRSRLPLCVLAATFCLLLLAMPLSRSDTPPGWRRAPTQAAGGGPVRRRIEPLGGADS
eukprot:CAMPEP_0179894238 /NCGR_PEP_ID=MMETSP0982-20121206/35181_1 /TAXON_ID=483367 /ORGANISM="non described non described, Strain CCMP 2436" /LENGTH=142 /DNA_ID=CAMNT_0021790819 /DNA_START=1 /DNA_END=426 /DNA_ORIENTATION=-